MESREETTITDVIVDGVERIEIFGDYGRIVYWQWRYHQGVWVKTTVDIAIIRPLSSFKPAETPLEAWCPNVVMVPGPETPGLIGPLN
jgi:hypothetical protein